MSSQQRLSCSVEVTMITFQHNHSMIHFYMFTQFFFICRWKIRVFTLVHISSTFCFMFLQLCLVNVNLTTIPTWGWSVYSWSSMFCIFVSNQCFEIASYKFTNIAVILFFSGFSVDFSIICMIILFFSLGCRSILKP